MIAWQKRYIFLAIAVGALLAVFIDHVNASPVVLETERPTNLISVGTRSFRCQCDPTVVDLNFSGECHPLSDGNAMLSAKCAAYADNCVCTEISYLVRRAVECTELFGGSALDAEVPQESVTPVLESPEVIAAKEVVRADKQADPLFDKLREDLAAFKVADFNANNDKKVGAAANKVGGAILKGCKAIKCKVFGNTPEFGEVKVAKRTKNGDFDVKLKFSKDPVTGDDGQTEAELRAIFTRESGFELQEKLGQGTFGAVYKATSDDGQVSAIKIVRMDKPESTIKDVEMNNLMLRAVGGTLYEQLFSLPRGMLKIKRKGRDDQLALVLDKME